MNYTLRYIRFMLLNNYINYMFQVLTPEPTDYVIDASSEYTIFIKQLICIGIVTMFFAIFIAILLICVFKN